MKTIRRIATIAIALLILVIGVVALYAARVQAPPTIAASPTPTATATAALATASPPAPSASNAVNVCGSLNAFQAASGTRNAILSLVPTTGQNFELVGTGSVPPNLGRDHALPELLRFTGRKVEGGNVATVVVADWNLVRVASCGAAFVGADTALPGADRFAVVVQKGCAPPGSPPYVRREDGNEILAPLGNGYLCQLNGTVSPEGRRLAYWHFESSGSSELALYQSGASTTLVRLGEEFLENAVWSADGTGLLFVAKRGGVQGVGPEYAALRTLDLATGAIQELTRVTGRYLTALAWDRARHVTAATETLASGGAGTYLVVGEDRVFSRSLMPANTVLASASPDAAYVMAVSQKDLLIRYWPLTAADDQKTLLAAPGFGAGLAAWRPGTRELAVVVSSGPGTQSLELWSLDGSRRRLTDYTGQGGGLFFRPDGSVLFFGGGAAVDIATGRVASFSLAPGERIAASLATAPTLSRGMCTAPGMTTAQVLNRYLDLTTSSDDAAVRDCFARSWIAKNGSPNARWSSAGPRSSTTIESLGPFRSCNWYSVRADFVDGNPDAPAQTGSYSRFIGIGPEGDRPRIYEMATAMVSRDLENDPRIGVAYCRD